MLLAIMDYKGGPSCSSDNKMLAETGASHPHALCTKNEGELGCGNATTG
jgi:hypothetical protein